VTKQELLELINDLPDSVTVLVQYENSYWATKSPEESLLHRLRVKDYAELRLHIINTKDVPTGG